MQEYTQSLEKKLESILRAYHKEVTNLSKIPKKSNKSFIEQQRDKLQKDVTLLKKLHKESGENAEEKEKACAMEFQTPMKRELEQFYDTRTRAKKETSKTF